jgi:hypothetical protein
MVAPDGEIAVSARFAVKVANKAANPSCRVRVSCGVSITEDDNPNGAQWGAVLQPVKKGHGFEKEEDGAWIGLLDKAGQIEFEAKSDPYPNLWTSTVQPLVTVLEWID